ncbi:hypothetical protein R6Q57_028190 [Mikania cordata]
MAIRNNFEYIKFTMYWCEIYLFTMELWGFTNLNPSFLFFKYSEIYYSILTVISKLLPPSDNAIICALQSDRYYCFLVPLTLPVLVVAVYFYWLSMKLFKHA